MATCIRCGSELPKGEATCPRCGGRRRPASEPPAAPLGTWSSDDDSEPRGPASQPPSLTVHRGGGEPEASPRGPSHDLGGSAADRSPVPVANALAVAEPATSEGPRDTGRRPRVAPRSEGEPKARVVSLPNPEDVDAIAGMEGKANESGEREKGTGRGDEASGQRAAEEPKASGAQPAPAVQRPPVLASESLREDIAPTEPGRETMRWVAAGAGLVGAGLALGLGGLDPVVLGVAAALLAVVGVSLAPLRYAVRAMTLLTVAVGGSAAAAAARVAEGAPLESPVLAVGALVLAGGLLFRSMYRASQLARGLVGAGMLIVAAWLALAGGFDGLATLDTSWQSWGPALVRVAFGLLLLLSLLAFMSANSTGGTGVWAVALLLTYAAQVGLQVGAALWPAAGPTRASLPDPGLGVAAAGTMLVVVGAIALTQSAAAWLGGTTHRRRSRRRDEPPSPDATASHAET